MIKEWKVARTQAHLHVNGNYSGITVSLAKCRPSDELIAEMNLPPLPKKGWIDPATGRLMLRPPLTKKI
ncbi:MAG: hypothetical protein ACOY5F_14400 [Pseudomonadota bacterium]